MKQLTKYHKSLYKELKEDLACYSGIAITAIQKVPRALQSVKGALVLLEAYVQAHPFAGEAEEIYFFKEIKPLYLSEQVFVIETALLQMKRTSASGAALKDMYEVELRKVHEFFGENREWYWYFLQDSTELDCSLFLRGAPMGDLGLPVMRGADPAFSTNGEYLWGRFIGMERVREWLEGEVEG